MRSRHSTTHRRWGATVAIGALTALFGTGVGFAAPSVHPATAPFPGPVGGPRLTGTGVVVQARPGTPAPPSGTAKAWLIADLNTGDVLAAKGPHVRLRPASTLKQLSALALIPSVKPSTKIVGTNADADIEGSKAGVSPGITYTARTLYYAMFLASGNDATNALARTAPGGITGTVARMQGIARQIGALDTTVVDPTGLDHDGQVSSAYDLALIVQAGQKMPDFRHYESTKYSKMPMRASEIARERQNWVKKHPGQPVPVFPTTYEIANQNRLLYHYEGTIGGKTGYTTLAQNTYTGVVKRGSQTLVISILHVPHGIRTETTALLDWTFANRAKLTPIGSLVTPQQVAAQAKNRGRQVDRDGKVAPLPAASKSTASTPAATAGVKPTGSAPGTTKAGQPAAASSSAPQTQPTQSAKKRGLVIGGFVGGIAILAGLAYFISRNDRIRRNTDWV